MLQGFCNPPGAILIDGVPLGGWVDTLEKDKQVNVFKFTQLGRVGQRQKYSQFMSNNHTLKGSAQRLVLKFHDL